MIPFPTRKTLSPRPPHGSGRAARCRAGFAALAASALCLIASPGLTEPPAPAPEAAAECRVLASTGDRFCKEGNRWVLANARAPELAVGDLFPVYEHSMLMDLDRYDLPPVDGPWRYYLRGGVIYKVAAATAEVIEVVGPARGR